MPETKLIVRVEDELKTAFKEAAGAPDRSVSQLLRDLMRDYVKRQKGQASMTPGYAKRSRQAATLCARAA